MKQLPDAILVVLIIVLLGVSIVGLGHIYQSNSVLFAPACMGVFAFWILMFTGVWVYVLDWLDGITKRFSQLANVAPTSRASRWLTWRRVMILIIVMAILWLR